MFFWLGSLLGASVTATTQAMRPGPPGWSIQMGARLTGFAILLYSWLCFCIFACAFGSAPGRAALVLVIGAIYGVWVALQPPLARRPRILANHVLVLNV
eukprot:jgi/Botrbrau1/21690/Bobra.43_1s0086.1